MTWYQFFFSRCSTRGRSISLLTTFSMYDEIVIAKLHGVSARRNGGDCQDSPVQAPRQGAWVSYYLQRSKVSAWEVLDGDFLALHRLVRRQVKGDMHSCQAGRNDVPTPCLVDVIQELRVYVVAWILDIIIGNSAQIRRNVSFGGVYCLKEFFYGPTHALTGTSAVNKTHPHLLERLSAMADDPEECTYSAPDKYPCLFFFWKMFRTLLSKWPPNAKVAEQTM